jgi:excisionase family DNA binding protein
MTNTIQVTNINPNELVELISNGIKEQLKEFSIKLNSEPTETLKPHLTRKETANYFNVSLNCVNMWVNKGIIKSYKVGQRVFFKREEILRVMFDQSKQA